MAIWSFNNWNLSTLFQRKKDKAENFHTSLPATRQTEQLARAYVKPVTGSRTDGKILPESKRTSVPEVPGLLVKADAKYALLNPAFPETAWQRLERFALTDPDIAFAIHNIATLGNTPINVSFDESLDDDTVQKLHEMIRIDLPHIYPGGLIALRHHLLRQLALYGALSFELVIKKDLSGLATVALVNPKTIRFYYDPATNRTLPVQVAYSLFPTQPLPPNGFVELNKYTYHYVGMDVTNDNPYAVPPMLQALDAAQMDELLETQYETMVNTFGSQGLLVGYVKPPINTSVTFAPTAPGVTSNPQEVGKMTLQQMLNDTGASLSKSVTEGILVGIEGTHKFEFLAPKANVEVAKGVQSINTERKLSGIKQDGLMLARTGNTTETLGRVLLSKATASIKIYQNLVDEAISKILMAHLTLTGNTVSYVMVESEPTVIGDEVRDAQAFQQKVETYMALYNQGIISQSQLAQILGFDKPAEQEPRQQQVAPPASTVPRDSQPASQQKRNNNPTDSRTTGAANQRRS